ncbi:MAG: S8 family serine peptidase [Flavobacteriaceae bacterium]|jgi:subtilisin family serine protease|nr:S8 family serine peptidase [Flavobacteriaceae bacterium]
MKLKNYIFVFLFFAFQSLSAQTTYYYYYNQKKYIDIDREFVAVNAVTNQNFLQSYASSYSSKTDFYKSTVRTSVTPVDSLAISRVSLQNYYLELQLTAAIKNDTLNYQNFINTLHQNPDVIKVSPCIRTAGGSLVGLTNYFYVKLHTATDESTLYTLAQSHNLEVVGKNPYMPLWYAVSCTKQNLLSVLEYANLFYESGFFEAAEPEFVYHGGNAGSTEPLQNKAQSANSVISSPNDMFYSDQWGLKNTGQHNGTPGIDIKAEQAWAFIQNNVPVPATIKIAIYDEGFDTNHPDLMGNMLDIPSGYDINDLTTSKLRAGQHHGTHCAGIAGAVQNNIGISGVAPQAKLVSISHDKYNRTSTQIAAGFNWAAEPSQGNVDVISCSWDAEGIESAQITNAINSALTNGRFYNGVHRGCVVVFCSGNSPDFTHNIVYPASSELVPNVLVVGAITPCGERKSPPHTCEIGSGNPDYSIGLWQSRYGSRLDVVAPGVRIPTTDAQGSAGSNPGFQEQNPNYINQTNYWSNFDGTSAATPHVAGIAALVLSVNPNLTAVQVNNIIEQTAQKVGGYDYAQTTGRPNGTWHEEMGYGLVDAYAAVQLAQSMATLDLMVKDSQEDLGIEPNTVTQYFWASPDIWIRNQDDNGLTHQNPEYSPTIPLIVNGQIADTKTLVKQ